MPAIHRSLIASILQPVMHKRTPHSCQIFSMEQPAYLTLLRGCCRLRSALDKFAASDFRRNGREACL